MAQNRLVRGLIGHKAANPRFSGDTRVEGSGLIAAPVASWLIDFRRGFAVDTICKMAVLGAEKSFHMPARRVVWSFFVDFSRQCAPMRQMSLMKHCVKLAGLMLAACSVSSSPADSPANSQPIATPAVTFLTAGHQDFWPCFSPDGSQILFSRPAPGTWELLLVPATGGLPKSLAQSPLPVAATRANWSRQNNRIAFTGTTSREESSIWLINSDGSNPHELQAHGLSKQVFYPSWFPDGEQVAAMDAADLVIKRIDLNAGAAITVTDHKSVLTGMPSVAPEGIWIAFAGQKNSGQQYDQTKNSIWLVNGDGATRTLELNPGQGRAPSWSPDGKRLAFESNRASAIGLYAIFLINRDGTGLTQVTDTVLNADHPVWSPAGHELAFSARESIWTKDRGIAVVEIRNDR
jgi:Tol biopolymer transport system component